MGPALIGSGSSRFHTRKCARKHGTGKADQMPCQAWVLHAVALVVSFSGWQEHRKLESSGKMASAQAEPRSRDSCRQQKPLQLVSTQSDLLLDLGDLKHVRRESPGVSPGALPRWEAVTFS